MLQTLKERFSSSSQSGESFSRETAETECVCYQRPGSQTGTSKCFQLFRHLGGQSLEVASSILLITHPEHTHTRSPVLVKVSTKASQLDSPLDDLGYLSLPVSNALLFGGQFLKVVFQLVVLSRQLVHKRAELKRSRRQMDKVTEDTAAVFQM